MLLFLEPADILKLGMEQLSHQPQRRPHLAQQILELARSKCETQPTIEQPQDGLVRMPGVQVERLLSDYRSPEWNLEYRTRTEAINNGWPQDVHFAIEQRRSFPLLGKIIADRRHQKMVNGAEQRRVKNLQARF